MDAKALRFRNVLELTSEPLGKVTFGNVNLAWFVVLGIAATWYRSWAIWSKSAQPRDARMGCK
eukprot:6186850-Pleurochrysis_carterae.AAC.5